MDSSGNLKYTIDEVGRCGWLRNDRDSDVCRIPLRKTTLNGGEINLQIIGKVSRINRLYDYGKIRADGGDKEIIFKSSVLIGTTIDDLQIGQLVTFDVEEVRSNRAINVRKIKKV